MRKTTLFTLAFLVNLAFIYAQNIITVDNSPGSAAQFNDLQSAISQAQDGDIIYVHPSEVNYGVIDVNKPLTLIGFSHSSSDKETAIDDIFLRNNASNTTIQGIHVTDVISTDGNSTTIENIVIENCLVDDGIYFEDAGMNNVTLRGNIIRRVGFVTSFAGSNNYSNALITNNIITDVIAVKSFQSITIKNNIFLSPNAFRPVFNANSASGSAEIQNSIFYFNTSSSPDPNEAGVTFSNCLTFNLSSGPVVALQGTNNLDNIDPLFVEDNDNTTFEPLQDNYQLLGNSLARGAGVNGEDLGLFDGSGFVFDNVGFTDGIPTINIQAISTTVAPGQNLNVIINTTNQ
ncbi:hypothetical protein FGF1_11080 [Flavobacteriaceae bacterium GF1]